MKNQRVPHSPLLLIEALKEQDTYILHMEPDLSAPKHVDPVEPDPQHVPFRQVG